jgi:hypothetical protein
MLKVLFVVLGPRPDLVNETIPLAFPNQARSKKCFETRNLLCVGLVFCAIFFIVGSKPQNFQILGAHPRGLLPSEMGPPRRHYGERAAISSAQFNSLSLSHSLTHTHTHIPSSCKVPCSSSIRVQRASGCTLTGLDCDPVSLSHPFCGGSIFLQNTFSA